VANGVGEQVGDEPFDEQGVSVEGCRCRHLVDADPQSVDLGLEVDKGRGDGRGEVDRFAFIEPALAAGEGEERLDQVRLLVVGGEHLLGGGTPRGNRRVGVVERNL
jgi:hypothetical protein